MSTSITLHQCMSLGMEVWRVCIDGRVLHEFLSEYAARRTFDRLSQKLNSGREHNANTRVE